MMVKEMKETTANKFQEMGSKNLKTHGISRKVFNNEEKLKMLGDLDEFSTENCKRNQIYIYLSLFLLCFTVITLIVITSSLY